MRKTLGLLALGAILEYYDFAIFIYFAGAIGHSLIPVDNPVANLIASFAILAIGAIIRPLGGAILAQFGDRHGRKNIFITTILLMAIPTFLIGLIPSWQQIGIFATIALIILRCLQGLAIGGEIPGSIVFAYELAHPNAKALLTNMVVAGTNVGFFCASFLAAHLLNQQNLPLASWRIAFMLGGIFGLISYFLRKNLNETPEFQRYQRFMRHRPPSPLKELLARHWSALWQITAFGAFLASSLAVFTFFMPTYLATFYHFPLARLLTHNSYAILIFIGTAIVAGKWHYLFGKKFFICSILIFDGLVVTLFLHYAELSLDHILTIHFILLAYIGLICGRLPVLAASFFPIQVRFSGVALSYNISFGIVAGLSQVILVSLIKVSGLLWLPALYIVAFSIPALIFMLRANPQHLISYH